MTAYDMSQTYESRHIKEFLGINKNQLFHWIQTKKLLRPIVLGEGRGGRTKFSIDNILTLALIKIINGYGIELNNLKKIMGCLEKTDFPVFNLNELLKNSPTIKRLVEGPNFKGSVWDYYRADREFFKKHGYTLEIGQGLKHREYRWAIESFEKDLRRKQIDPEWKEIIEDIRAQYIEKVKPRPFFLRGLDGESQALVLSYGMNPSNHWPSRKVWGKGAPPWPSHDITMIVNLLAIIRFVEYKTKREV